MFKFDSLVPAESNTTSWVSWRNSFSLSGWLKGRCDVLLISIKVLSKSRKPHLFEKCNGATFIKNQDINEDINIAPERFFVILNILLSLFRLKSIKKHLFDHPNAERLP